MTKKPHLIDIHVGTALRRQRCYAGMSQNALAESVGITFQQLQKYELAINRVSASRLWDLAQELSAPIDSFFPSQAGTPPGLAWQDDPAFARWVRAYHETPEGSRESLMKVVKLIAKERL